MREQTSSPPTPPVGTARPAHRLGPPIVIQRLDHPIFGRLYALALLLTITAGLTVAAKLNPAGRMMGTHQQLGLPPCGMLFATGYPCPTCGMTTAFSYTLHGQWLLAMHAQLAGFAIALASVACGLAAACCAVTGGYPAPNWYRISPTALSIAIGGLLVIAWAAKIIGGLWDGTLPVR